MKKSDDVILPIFSYVGGKRWLKKELNTTLNNILIKNKNIDTYVEPFMGGLGAFFSNIEILKNNNIKNVILNDLNVSVYSFYKYLITDKEKLFSIYDQHELDFINTIPENLNIYHKIKDKDIIKSKLISASNIYKEKRRLFNKCKNISSVENAALFLFLQNHCFNGFYRENKSGDYNTAFNWEKKESLNNKSKINLIVNELSNFNIELKNKDYKDLSFNENQIIYADPPYINDIEGTENNYNKESFSIQTMRDLIETISPYNYIFSHYKSEKILDFFQSNNHSIKYINKKNTVSGHKETRSKIMTEMLVSFI